MDEIDRLKKTKKMLNLALIIGLTIIFIMYKVLEKVTQGYGKYVQELESFNKYIFSVTVGLGILVYIAVYLIVVIKYKGQYRFEGMSVKEIRREIPQNYSPAICSVLINKKIEAYKDYTATILYLELKKYLKLDFSDNDYKIEAINTNIKDLNEHEKYVFECVTSKKIFDIDKFKEKVTEDMLEQKLVRKLKERKQLTENIMFMLSLITGYMCFLGGKTYMGAILIIAMFCIFMRGVISANTVQTKIECSVTEKGKEITKEIFKLKNFIKEYTLLTERNIEYKELAGEYLAYAIALGEARTIEKFLEENEKYRKLIYLRVDIDGNKL